MNAPADYTQTMSGAPRMVWPGDKGHPTHVIFWSGPGTTERAYTWNSWYASLCEEAYLKKLPIVVAYSVTTWGRLIIDVELAEPMLPTEPAA